MKYNSLVQQIQSKRSFLCVGLDSDRTLLPTHLSRYQDAIFLFNKEIIDATAPYAVAFKPNTAFYEAEGINGWEQLSNTVKYIRLHYPNMMIIADAKRGDIGNTTLRYARAFFEELDVDAVTVSPYMGSDSILPFLQYQDRWVVVLALTSNVSAADFELQLLSSGQPLYEAVIEKCCHYGSKEQMMFVVGATRPQRLAEIRRVVPDHFLLVPGVGVQGGNLAEVAKYGMNSGCGLLVNLSRDILYADSSLNFASAASCKASEIALEMGMLLK